MFILRHIVHQRKDMGQFDPPSYNVSTSVPIFGRVIINIFRTTAKTAGLNKFTLTQFMHQTKQIY
jgi:hypothetical protein